MNTKKLNLPKTINKNQAEIAGIMFGDGNMSVRRYTYQMNIACNSKKDLEYAEYIKTLFIKEFGIMPKTYVYKNKSAIVLYIHSKMLVEYFYDILKVQLSPKKLDYFPEYILANKDFLKSFLRGLLDTDGCITFQIDGKYRYVLLKICTIHKIFAEEIKKSLSSLGIRSFICIKRLEKNKVGYDIVIRHKNAEIFMNLIGSNNPRNKIKWGYRDLNSRDNA